MFVMCLTKIEAVCSFCAFTSVVSIIGPICSGFGDGVTVSGESFEGDSGDIFSGGVGGTAVLTPSGVLLVHAKIVDNMSWCIIVSPIKR